MCPRQRGLPISARPSAPAMTRTGEATGALPYTWARKRLQYLDIVAEHCPFDVLLAAPQRLLRAQVDTRLLRDQCIDQHLP